MIIRNLLVIIFFAGIVYGITTYLGQAKQILFPLLHLQGGDVKGASTQRAEELSGQLQSDIQKQAALATDKALQFSLGDLIGVVSRLQQIPQDIQTTQQYIQEQVGNVIESRK